MERVTLPPCSRESTRTVTEIVSELVGGMLDTNLTVTGRQCSPADACRLCSRLAHLKQADFLTVQ